MNYSERIDRFITNNSNSLIRAFLINEIAPQVESPLDRLVPSKVRARAYETLFSYSETASAKERAQIIIGFLHTNKHVDLGDRLEIEKIKSNKITAISNDTYIPNKKKNELETNTTSYVGLTNILKPSYGTKEPESKSIEALIAIFDIDLCRFDAFKTSLSLEQKTSWKTENSIRKIAPDNKKWFWPATIIIPITILVIVYIISTPAKPTEKIFSTYADTSEIFDVNKGFNSLPREDTTLIRITAIYSSHTSSVGGLEFHHGDIYIRFSITNMYSSRLIPRSIILNEKEKSSKVTIEHTDLLSINIDENIELDLETIGRPFVITLLNKNNLIEPGETVSSIIKLKKHDVVQNLKYVFSLEFEAQVQNRDIRIPFSKNIAITQ